MLKQFNSRLRDKAVITAAILSVFGHDMAVADQLSFGNNQNDKNTTSPIKHVIIIMGENRTFDHVFATYQPKPGQTVSNLLSKGIIDINGNPGANYLSAQQYATTTGTTYANSFSAGSKSKYGANVSGLPLQDPSISYAPVTCYTNVATASLNGPGCMKTLALAAKAECVSLLACSLPLLDLPLLTEGAIGPLNVGAHGADLRITNYNVSGPYPLVNSSGHSLYDTYGGSPVHRFYQMWQELDCDAAVASTSNPSGCQNDLFPWVEQTVSSGGNGGTPPQHEGSIAMGFYNVAKGDAPYFMKLANKYTLNDNYHQPVMGGTYANQMMFAYADALYYAGADGNPATPPTSVMLPNNTTVSEVENPDPQPMTNNWYTQDGYGGGSYTNCSDTEQPGVNAIVTYLGNLMPSISPNCAENAYYLLNNYVPSYIGSGATDPTNNGPFTLPPVRNQRHIGDSLTQGNVSWAYFGERWNDFKTAPGLGANFGALAPIAYLYCNICNPFLYSSSVMENAAARTAHLKDTKDLYEAILFNQLPAVSYVKPSTFNDGHPASSKFSLFEAFTKKIIELVQLNPKLWASTAIIVTVDEGGGYYDSGYVQPVDYFGDGTRIPLIMVSPYSQGGIVSHEYSDHASIVKFIERNWNLPKLSERTRDNLPNPMQTSGYGGGYAPTNSPAIGDLWGNFSFGP
jgi:phospholipase C